MSFTKIDRTAWPREEYFNHYFSQVPCTYSGTFKLDITRLRQSGQKLYPAMLYYLSTVVNRHQEFRMALNEAREPGYYDVVHPCYTIFHKRPRASPTCGRPTRLIMRPSAPPMSRTWQPTETTRA